MSEKTMKKKLSKFRRTINNVQTYEGERYPEKLKKEIAQMIKKGVSRYRLSKESGIHYTLIRNWDIKFNG